MTRRLWTGLAALGLSALVAGTPGFAQSGLAGSYLAGRLAAQSHDFDEATQYLTRALSRDPGNALLMERLVLAYVGLGQVDRAVPVARRLDATGQVSQIARLVLLASDRMADRSFERRDGVGGLINDLTAAWALIGAGTAGAGLEAFDTIIATEGLDQFGRFHKALAQGLIGDLEGADATLTGGGEDAVTLSRRGVLAHAEIRAALEDTQGALEVLARLGDQDGEAAALRRQIDAGAPILFSRVQSAREGEAEVYYTIAAALQGEAEPQLTLLYSRLAEYLAPGHVDAVLLSAAMLENLKQYDLADRAFARVNDAHPAFVQAEIGRAGVLYAADRADEAVEVLTNLGSSHPDRFDAHVARGDLLRRMSQFGDATQAYDSAISLLAAPQQGNWALYYARGITHERQGNWPEAEADFRQALTLQPEQPLVLNYLGYSLVEKGRALDEALQMIETAVAARPNDGYITDSLGWALYKLGRVDEAVPHMERAVSLRPVDPIINDHLGDVYWVVGREREARFQWRRALSFGPEAAEETRIRRKLEVGLDQVLEEEAQEEVADNGSDASDG